VQDWVQASACPSNLLCLLACFPFRLCPNHFPPQDLFCAHIHADLSLPLVLLTARSLEEAPNSVWTFLGTNYRAHHLGVRHGGARRAASTPGNHRNGSRVARNLGRLHGARDVQPPPGARIHRDGQTYILMALILYLWAHAPTLNRERRCFWCCPSRRTRWGPGGSLGLW
jgi:hypothetical protein